MGISQEQTIEPLTTKEGLTDNYAHFTKTIFRDSLGYVWITTYSGLNRYDGYEITRFNQVTASSSDLPVKRLSTITGDKNGNLWLGTDINEIIFYDRKDETFTKLSELVHNMRFPTLGLVNILRVDDQDRLYIYTANNGVYYYDSKTHLINKLEYLKKNENITTEYRLEKILRNGDVVFCASDLLTIKGDSIILLSDKYIRRVIELPNRKLFYYGPNSDSRFIYDLKTDQEVSFKPGEDISKYFLENEDGYDLYGVTLHGSPVFREGKLDLAATLGNKELPDLIFDLCYDLSGDIIYSSVFEGAGKIINKNTILQKTVVPGQTLLKKIEDSVYTASYGTVSSVHQDRISPFIVESPNLNQTQGAWNICKNVDGSIIISNEDNPITTSVYTANDHTLQKTFKSTLHDQMELLLDGNIAVDSRQRWNIENSPITFIGEYYEALSEKPFPGHRVRYFYQSSNQDIWMSTLQGDLIRVYDNYQKYEFVNADPKGQGELRNSVIYYIYEAYGKTYFCNEAGIDVYDSATNLYDHIDLKIGTIPFYVKGMIHDDKNQIWIMDYNVLYCYDPVEKTVKKFSIPETYKIRVNPCKDLIFHKNQILYKSADGIVRLDINKLDKIRSPQNVVFQDLYIDRKKIYPKDATEILDSSLLYQPKFDLLYNQRNVGFKFVSIDSRELSAEYEYRLVGLYDEWTNIGDERVVHFTNLSPGDYQFEVSVQSSAGKSSLRNSVRSFTVLAPWYATWFAYLLYLVIIGSIIYTIYTLQINKIREQEQLRSKISSDLHDDVGSILAGLAIQSELTSKMVPKAHQNKLLEISEMSRSAMELMRDTVWAMDPRKDKYENLIDRMTVFAETSLSRKDINYSIDTDKISGHEIMKPTVRKSIYLIFKEAITNIVKHADTDSVVISFKKEGDTLILIIWNNVNHQKNSPNEHKLSTDGQGLLNMKMRAEQVGGSLQIVRENGFEVKLTIYC